MSQDRKLPASIAPDLLLDYQIKPTLTVADLPEIYLDLHQSQGQPESLFTIIEACTRGGIDPEEFIISPSWTPGAFPTLTVSDLAFFDPSDEAQLQRRDLVYYKALGDLIIAIGMFLPNEALQMMARAHQNPTVGEEEITPDSCLHVTIEAAIARVEEEVGSALIDDVSFLIEDFGHPFDLLGQSFTWRWWELCGDDAELFDPFREQLAIRIWEARIAELIRFEERQGLISLENNFQTAVTMIAQRHLPLSELIIRMVKA